MAGPANLMAFAAASFVLAIIPGPAVVFLTTQTLAHGRRAGLASVAGVTVGNLGNAALAGCGLALILAASATAFTVVRLGGAAYLIWLGLRALMQAPRSTDAAQSAPGSRRMFRDALFVALLNPKTALFFAALLPQFVDPRSEHPLVANLMLSAVFVGIALCTDTIYVLTAASLRKALGRHRWSVQLGRYVSAGTFFALGLYAASGGRAAGK
ncbi:MAG: LysE family translocator [Proteobacteria bacterium]|nr:LysE family translocator [Pseudomonadota bacterium]